MENIYSTYRPEGYGTVTPYIMADNPAELIDFLKNAFYAEEKSRNIHPETGQIANCILRIGESCFMISGAREKDKGMRTSFYLYTEQPDELYQRALEYGAVSEFAPMDMPYDDRQGGVIDPAGNYWWISKRLVEKNYQ